MLSAGIAQRAQHQVGDAERQREAGQAAIVADDERHGHQVAEERHVEEDAGHGISTEQRVDEDPANQHQEQAQKHRRAAVGYRGSHRFAGHGLAHCRILTDRSVGL
jgi:hypothetical protein